MKDIENNSTPVGWYGRGYLPHFDGGSITQFFTFRLFDSLPQSILDSWREQLEHCGQHEMEVVLQRRIEKYLDQNYGSCFLRDVRVAQIVQDSLIHFDHKRYNLHAWVVMPNHIHFLITPFEGNSLESIAHSIRSFTAHEANKLLNRRGQFWMHEPFDRYIRDADHFETVVAYIENNPVKARLCKNANEWKFSSAYWRIQMIEEES